MACVLQQLTCKRTTQALITTHIHATHTFRHRAVSIGPMRFAHLTVQQMPPTLPPGQVSVRSSPQQVGKGGEAGASCTFAHSCQPGYPMGKAVTVPHPSLAASRGCPASGCHAGTAAASCAHTAAAARSKAGHGAAAYAGMVRARAVASNMACRRDSGKQHGMGRRFGKPWIHGAAACTDMMRARAAANSMTWVGGLESHRSIAQLPAEVAQSKGTRKQ